MADSDNRELARRFFEDFCTKRQRALATELMAPDFAGHDPQVPGLNGPDAMADAVAIFQDGLDGAWTVEQIIPGEGGYVTVRWTGTGTHNAPLMGIPPTGKQVRVDAISVLRIADGKIAEM
jgi:predicted ester cyclase